MKPTRHATGERAAKAAAALFRDTLADPATPAPRFDPVPVRTRKDGWTGGPPRGSGRS